MVYCVVIQAEKIGFAKAIRKNIENDIVVNKNFFGFFWREYSEIAIPTIHKIKPGSCGAS